MVQAKRCFDSNTRKSIGNGSNPAEYAGIGAISQQLDVTYHKAILSHTRATHEVCTALLVTAVN